MKECPQIKLYKYTHNAFQLQAIIDDVRDLTFEHNYYDAGQFIISINNRIPNAQKFERGLFVQFGNDDLMFGEIVSITDALAQDGTHIRNIIGYDARYIFKRRVIKNLNDNGKWSMTASGETCLRSLIQDQCGSNAEAKRRLPIVNEMPVNAIGKNYSVSEEFTNLYEVCRTIATQSEFGWRVRFNGTLTLECFTGNDISNSVVFSPEFDSLANGNFSDSAENFCNAIYVGGKGQNDKRDIYEGEKIIGEVLLKLNDSGDDVLALNDRENYLAIGGTVPENMDRFETWDNQSSMTTEVEYETEAKAVLVQYGQTIEMTGNALIKCPYVFKENYNVGDFVTLEFSGKSAVVQILSINEHWARGAYTLAFTFGKPVNNLGDQMQILLRKIQQATNRSSAVDSVKWYILPDEDEENKSDVTFDTLGFTGDTDNGVVFTMYLDKEQVGSKRYNIYVKNLTGTGITLTTGVTGATDLVLQNGSYVTMIYIDTDGNILKVV